MYYSTHTEPYTIIHEEIDNGMTNKITHISSFHLQAFQWLTFNNWSASMHIVHEHTVTCTLTPVLKGTAHQKKKENSVLCLHASYNTDAVYPVNMVHIKWTETELVILQV